MTLKLSTDQLDNLWESQKGMREDQTLRQDYYAGRHAIISREDNTYADGTPKSKRVANWVKYIVNRYVGLITSTPYQITAKEGGGEGIDTYAEVADNNALDAIDVENLRATLIFGTSVELH